MTDKDSKKYEGAARHDGPDHSSPYPVSRLSGPIDLVDVARQIEQADQLVNTRVSAKLKVIADQIKALQAEAQEVLNEAQADQALHRARCSFRRISGKVYHLYAKSDGTAIFLC